MSEAANRGEPTGPLSGYSVVYFGNGWFAENRTSSHHVARRLAKSVPVLYVDSPGTRPPTTSGRDIKRLWRKLVDSTRLPQQLGDQLWHCTVPQIPYRTAPGVDRLNRAFGLWAVRRAIHHVGFKRRISWFVLPHPGFMAQQLGEDLCVYYCVDDHAARPGVDAPRVTQSELALTAAADLVFVASPALLDVKQRQHPRTVFAPHGVDADLFGQAMDPETVIPERVRALSRPVIGFFGAIASWVDVELVEWLASVRPAWTFLLVGQAFTDISALRTKANVLLAGPQPYESLAQWAKAFDVAIIPYRLNQQVRHANPLKLREYLAAGRPVVSVPNPEIERFANWVHIAESREAFLRAMEAALQPEPPDAARRRMAAVADMTWDNRVAEVMSTVRHALESKSATRPEVPQP